MLRRSSSLFIVTIFLAIIGFSTLSIAFTKTKTDINMPDRLSAEKDWLAYLNQASGWINSKSLAPADLRGKVVLIDFCTYTCINWLRTLPYIRAWFDKYKDKGLMIIGVHTPEFSFERDMFNVRRAIQDLGIDYPVAMDNDYAIWNGFNNQYWPALYFIDAKGRLRHYQFGEGGYEQCEKMIQQLLEESGAKEINKEFVSVNAKGVELDADWTNLNSSENYLNYDRTQNFVSSDLKRDGQHNYSASALSEPNSWTLSGNWTMGKHFIRLNKAGGKISYRFHARDLHIVMGPRSMTSKVHFRILIDGKPPSMDHGIDVDEEGKGVITEQRLYQLIRQSKPITERVFEIEFLDPGVEAFAFTFG